MSNNVRPESMVRITDEKIAAPFIEEQVKEIRTLVGNKKVLLALSGGVDSSVVAALLIKAIGRNLVCVHVNHGLLRKGKPEQVVEIFRNQMDANLIYVDATDRFLDLLAGVADPETIDKTWELATGAPNGPFRILDVVGLVTAYNIVSMNPAASDPESTPGKICAKLKAMIDAGKTGVNAGEGFYKYN